MLSLKDRRGRFLEDELVGALWKWGKDLVREAVVQMIAEHTKGLDTLDAIRRVCLTIEYTQETTARERMRRQT